MYFDRRKIRVSFWAALSLALFFVVGMGCQAKFKNNEDTSGAQPLPVLSTLVFTSSAAHDFGNVTALSTSSAVTYTIQNTGTTDVTGCSFSPIAPTDFTYANNTCLSTIAAGASCSVDVAGRPAVVGHKNIALSMTCSQGVTGANPQLHVTGVPGGIYRSVGPGNTSALATGAGNPLTIAYGVATFASALPSNVGVGDVIQYDYNASGIVNRLAFIVARLSATNFLVQDSGVAAPTATTTPDNDWSVYRAYISLNYAVTGTENTGIDASLRNFDAWSGGTNLTALGHTWNIACYGDAPDNVDGATNAVVGTTWVTNAVNYLRIYTPYLSSEVGVSQRHAGVFTTTKYYLTKTDATQEELRVQANFVRVEGLQFNGASSPNASWDILLNFSGQTNGAEVRVSNNIIRGNTSYSVDASGVVLQPNVANVTFKVWNNIIYDFSGTCITDNTNSANGHIYLYGNTLYRCAGGFVGTSKPLSAIDNISQVNASDFCFSASSIDVDSSNNVCGSTNWTAGATPNTLASFVNTTAGTEDLHLSVGDVNARGLGANLSSHANLSFSDACDSGARSVPWNIGAL